MKKVFVAWIVSCAAGLAGAAVTYDYTGQGAVFNGTNQAQVVLNDGGTAVQMTVASVGGDLKSLSSEFGIGNTRIDGMAEILTISFDKAVDLVSVDLGNVGTSISAGARLKIGSLPDIDLYTGVAGFNGNTDVYTPAAPIRLNAGEAVVLKGSSETSSFHLQKMTFAVVPEPAAAALTGLGGLLAVLIRRMVKA